MAKVIPVDLEDLLIEIRDSERLYSEIHSDIANIYEELEYDNVPKSKAERNKRGLKGPWNGLETSFEEITIEERNGKTTLVAMLSPTRYLVGQAMREYAKRVEGNSERTLLPEEINSLSPNMANVSLSAIIEMEGKYYFVGQIKGGDTLGGGQIHASIIAGGVKYANITQNDENPLVNALRQEAADEMGIDPTNLTTSSFSYIVDERDIGMINIGAISKNFDFDTVLEHYKQQTRRKIDNGVELEVAGLALIPIDIENGGLDLDNIIAYIPNEDRMDIINNYKPAGLRNFTVALNECLIDKNNISYFLYKAGLLGEEAANDNNYALAA